ncbi:MAG: NUDIX domain-containing protein, partial [Candidatus Heimdallarchaeota archaeon]|nr:NUDIX domain-containing protein [Candidatus Heimdallarchaeota archaeon]
MRNLSSTNFEKHRLGVGGICVHKEKVLLIRHSFGINIGKWSIPGGYVEIGETLSEAVVREVLEETGVKTRV